MTRQIRMMVYLVCLIPLTSFTWYNPMDVIANDYLETYADLAVVEMYRSGIPASIILAQGLHESNYGTSDLATKANNHFGIKCKSYWQGGTFYHEDDDYKRGKLIESCFRSYNSALESYVDHSNFLMQSSHYGKLFELSKTDYIGWAYGLKECGYATDISYTQKLIKKIEKYNLDVFDRSEDPFRSILKN